MAGYLGTKAVLLSTTAANVAGDMTVDGGTSSKITIASTNASGETGSLEFYRTNASHAVSQIVDEREGDLNGGKLKFKTSDTSGAMRLRMDIDQGGDISFYEDTGADAKLFWDASAEALGIGTDSPTSPLHIKTGADGNILQMNGAADAWELMARSSNGASPLSGEVIYSLGMYRDDGPSSPNGVINFGRGSSSQNGYLTFDVNGLEAMRFAADGKVGINNTNPTHVLDVSGSARFLKPNNDPNLILETTDTDASAGPILELLRNPGQAGANNDILGKVQFRGLNSASEDTRFAEMYTRIIDASDGSEDGRFAIDVTKDGTLRSALNIDMGLSEVVINDGSVDIDFRVESNSDTHAFFVEGSTGNVGMSVSDPSSHLPQTHNTNKRSFVSYFTGGTQFVCGRSDTAVVADDYIGGYLFKTNDSSNNKFGGMTAKVDDTTGNGILEFFPVSTAYDSSDTVEGIMQLGDTNDLFLRTGGIRCGRSEKNAYTTNEEAIGAYHIGSGSGDTWTVINSRDGTGGDHVFRHQRQGVVKSEIEENGDYLSATNSYGGVSDERLKENIVAASSQWDDIKALQFKNYSMIDAELDAPNMLGVMAQDLQASGMGGLVKQTFKTNGDDEPVLDADGNQEEYLSVKYSVLYMKAIKALQEAMTKIETLETKVAALEGV